MDPTTHQGHTQEDVDAHRQLTTGHYKDADSTPFFHRLIAGAAAYEAARVYARHVEKEGEPASHDQAQRLAAGFAGAWVDKLLENKLLRREAAEGAKRYTGQETLNRVEQKSEL